MATSHETKVAIQAAWLADAEWEEVMRAAGVDRWNPASSGVTGSPLRAAYDAKVAADRVMNAAFESDRRANSVKG